MDNAPTGRRQWLGDQQPVERFKPTTGAFVGWSGLALAAGAFVWVALNEHSSSGLRIGLGALFGAVVIWTTQLRPRVTAYPRALLMHGSVRDTYVPYAAIDEVTMGQTLNVWAGGRRYMCVGIGKSVGYEMRQRVRAQGSGSGFGANRGYQFLVRAEAGEREPKMSYHNFVLTRIRDLVARTHQQREPDGRHPPVRQSYAVPEIVGLVVTGGAFLFSLLVR